MSASGRRQMRDDCRPHAGRRRSRGDRRGRGARAAIARRDAETNLTVALTARWSPTSTRSPTSKTSQPSSATARSFCFAAPAKLCAVIKLPPASGTCSRSCGRAIRIHLLRAAGRLQTNRRRAISGRWAARTPGTATSPAARAINCDAEFLEVHVDRAGAAVPAPPEPGGARRRRRRRCTRGSSRSRARCSACSPTTSRRRPARSSTRSTRRRRSSSPRANAQQRAARLPLPRGRRWRSRECAGAGRGVLSRSTPTRRCCAPSLLCPGAAGLEVCDASVSSDAADDGGADPWVALEELCARTPSSSRNVGDLAGRLARLLPRVLPPRAPAGGRRRPALFSEVSALPQRPRARERGGTTRRAATRGSSRHGVTCKELRLLFDARGKLLEAERDARAAAEKEEERKRRARVPARRRRRGRR